MICLQSALVFMELARWEMTTTFPGTYPFDGMILSRVGDVAAGRRLIPRLYKTPSTGHRFPTTMSRSVILNATPERFARDLARQRR